MTLKHEETVNLIQNKSYGDYNYTDITSVRWQKCKSLAMYFIGRANPERKVCQHLQCYICIYSLSQSHFQESIPKVHWQI